jgi:outer membrane immunogenic protein
MKKLLLASVTLIVVSAPVLAADMPVKYKAPPPVAIFSWTGCYIGVNAGGKWGRFDDNWAASSNFSGPEFISASGTHTSDGSGFIGGGQIGCNYQTGVLVWGIEGDFNGTSFKGSRDLATANLGFAQIYHSDYSERWLSTVRGRIGFAADRWMAYVTGGLAVASIESNDSVFFASSGSTFSGSSSEVTTGYAVGGGIEGAIWDSWSVKAEYLYVNIKSPDVNLTSPAFPAFVISTTHRVKENIFRVGLNYRFGYTPVVAKY